MYLALDITVFGAECKSNASMASSIGFDASSRNDLSSELSGLEAAILNSAIWTRFGTQSATQVQFTREFLLVP